jgi:hypothetical protein
MKKTKMFMLMFLLSFLVLSALIILKANATMTKTFAVASSLDDVTVDQVNHAVKILGDGSITINDTVKLRTIRDTTLTEYALGFPYGYQSHLAYVYAFNTANPSQSYDVSLDTGLEGKLGYYGVTVVFPQGGVQLLNDTSFSFTAVFVFSESTTSSTATHEIPEQFPPKNETKPVLTMSYPVYPSLLQNASVCKVTVALPPKTEYDGYSDPMFINSSGRSDTGETLNMTKRPLERLTSAPSWLNFSTTEEGAYRAISINELGRHVEIDGWGNIFVTDEYAITSQMQQIASGMRINLPQGVRNVSAFDAQGNKLAEPVVINETTGTYTVSFGVGVEQGKSLRFKLTYFLPSSDYLNKVGLDNFVLNLPILKNFDRVAGKFTFRMSLPEGAAIKEYPKLEEFNLQRGALQEEMLLTGYNVSSYSNLDLQMTYVYSVFWASFRPTLWVTAIVAIALVIALVWQRPKFAPISPIHGAAAKPQTLRAIVSSYEARTKTLAELESIERQAQKGRLPRRRYKIRKRMLESQLTRVDRELVDLKQRVKSVGPKYAEILKDLDVAEAELEGIEVEQRRIEARYRSGAITMDAYKRLQDQCNKRKEKAKTIIDGALLRLSEGIV